jgi:hypothetical protein
VRDLRLENALPVRKIPKNYLGVTGAFASLKNGRMVGFESLLEKDLFVLLEYDDEVLAFEEQPVRVPLNGRGRSYVPDVVIHFRPSSSSKVRKSILVEVKTTEDLEKNKAKYAHKFADAKRLASSKGWVFKTRTEKEIRNRRLKFLKFLREYHCIEPDVAAIGRVLAALGELGGQATFNRLLQSVCSSEEEQLTTIPVIWHMVATGQLIVDLDQAITDEILLTLPQDRSRA